jgi:murein DD-endopeptidase MepM/ murein hydrolase activator NlpD
MRRLLLCLLLATTLAAVAGSTPSAGASVPSASVPNGPGLRLPPSWTHPPLVPERRSYDQLLALWQQAGTAYGIPWQVLAAINKVESNFGRNMGPSSAGALGWMQFMPSTWLRWGVDANADGVASPWTPEDAIYAAARYLAAAGGTTDIRRGVFAYNHADWYVDEVLQLAQLFGDDGADFGAGLDAGLFGSGLPTTAAGPKLVFRIDDIQKRIAKARARVTRAQQALVQARRDADKLNWKILDAEQKAGNPGLTDAQFRKADARVSELTARQDASGEQIQRYEDRLDYEVTRLDELKKEAATTEPAVGFSAPVGAAFGGAISSGDYVFPVGGGPSAVSVGHTHHDYPAADIAAPEGSPVYALSDAVVLDAWPSPSGNCGIGLKLRSVDGHDYVYCHLAYLEPSVQPGAALSAGASVGLVGQTGHATGPHLHLQYSPTSEGYPQASAWFESFAGRAFSWQDAPTPAPAAATAPATGKVFDVVDSDVVTFTR